MKALRAFVNGLAVMLAVFILIYLLATYAKFTLPEAKAEAGISKVRAFIEQAQFNRDYIRLVLFFSLAALSGILFKKKPAVPLFVAVLLCAFVLQLYANGQLTKRPMVLTIFAAVIAAGDVILCAWQDRLTGSVTLSRAGLAATAVSLAICSVCSVYQHGLYVIIDGLTKLEENGIKISDKFKGSPRLLRMVIDSFENRGTDAARELYYHFNRQIDPGEIKEKFFGSLDGSDFRAGLALTLLVFGSAVLCFVCVMRKKTLPAALISSVPAAAAFVLSITDRLDSLGLPVMLTLSVSFVCFAAEYGQISKGHDPAYDADAEVDYEPAVSVPESGGESDGAGAGPEEPKNTEEIYTV